MAVKKKTKKQSNTKTKTKVLKRSRTKKNKVYPAYVLGIVLVVCLMSESALVLNATPNDWHAGLSVLDVSSGVTAMVSDVSYAFSPATFAASSINEFYNQAAIATNQLLDPTVADQTSGSPMTLVYGINNFYEMAANQMASILDISNYSNAWQPKVAGASITTYK